MDSNALFRQIQLKKSFLCIGLDTDFNKIPVHLRGTTDPLFAFNKEIIDATHRFAVAYKPNLAFYEAHGVRGWESLSKTVSYIRKVDPNIFIIADAKRGDIGNTSSMYAQAFFTTMDCDAVTVAPYMGEDSVKPFLGYLDKWVIVLALTSNKGASDFQFRTDADSGDKLFETVIKRSSGWGDTNNMMYVVGATKADMLAEIRALIPDHFLLVPGVGAQGGSLLEVVNHGMNSKCGLLVNASRSIIYADSSEKFAQAAALEASKLASEMAQALVERKML